MTRSRPQWRHIPALTVLALAVGCAPPPEDAAPTATSDRPASPGATVLERPPWVQLPDGARVTLEVATTPEERNRGLMFRTSLDEDRGMLFVFDMPGYPSFWMKDTWIALDILFLDERGVIRDMAADVPPCAAEPCPLYSSSEPVMAVLEVAAGVAAAHGVTIGSTLEFERVPGLPRRPPG